VKPGDREIRALLETSLKKVHEGAMNRRAFLSAVTGGLLTAPLAVEAQPAGKMWRIGVLSSGSPSAVVARIDAFKQGLRELGYVDGQNLAMEYRWAEGREDRLSALAADLVRLRVDIIVTQDPAGVGLLDELHQRLDVIGKPYGPVH
jgi:putative ABC transport system substrate-binding protein